MLPEVNRLRRSVDFARVTRGGRRCAGASLVVHMELGPGRSEPVVGFVVSRAVGGAVVRNAVTRRLRALVRDRLDMLPPGAGVVVRARSGAASTSYPELSAQLDRCLAQLVPATEPATGPATGPGAPR